MEVGRVERRDERTKRLFAAVFNLPSSIFHLPELRPRHIFLSTWSGWEAGRALSVSVESGHPRSRLALARRRQVFTNPPQLRSGIPRAIFIPGKHSGSAWRFEEQLAADWPYSRGILTGARRSPTGVEKLWLRWLSKFFSCCPIREQDGVEWWKAGCPCE